MGTRTRKSRVAKLLLVLVIFAEPATGFGPSLTRPWLTPKTGSRSTSSISLRTTTSLAAAAASTSVEQVQNILLPNINTDDQELSFKDETIIRSALQDLADGTCHSNLIADTTIDDDNNKNTTANNDLWQPLLGTYQVLYTLPSNANERPVGGKWSRNPLLRVTGSWQHLVEPSNSRTDNNTSASNIVAQAMNLIHIRAFGLWRISVLLRGDATPLSEEERHKIARERQTPYGGLSPRTLQADFDPPKIIISSLRNKNNNNQQKANRTLACLSLGPVSSVILDTPYVDARMRIGKGSRGSVFVFGRTQEAWVNEEWQRLVAVKPWKKSLVAAASTVITATLAFVGARLWRAWWQRCLLIPWLGASILSTWMVTMGSGGIERDPPIQQRDTNSDDGGTTSTSSTTGENFTTMASREGN